MHTAEGINEHLHGIVRRAALPVTAGELIAQQIDRAARRLGISRGLVKRLWYREQRSVPAHVALELLEFDRRTAGLRGELERLQGELDAFGER
jgi:hypothetical protein